MVAASYWLPLQFSVPTLSSATALAQCMRISQSATRPGGNAEVCESVGLGHLPALADGDTDPDIIMRRGLHQVRRRAERVVSECERPDIYAGTTMKDTRSRMASVMRLRTIQG